MTEKKNKFIDLKGANSTMKLGLAIYAAMVVSFVLGACFCYAAGDPISTVSKLSSAGDDFGQPAIVKSI